MWKNVEKCGGVWGGVGGKNAEKHGNTRKNMEKREKYERPRSETLKCRTVGILCRPMLASAIRTLRLSSFRNSWTSIFARSKAENKRDCRVFSSKFSPRRKLRTLTAFTLQFLPFQSTIKRLKESAKLSKLSTTPPHLSHLHPTSTSHSDPFSAFSRIFHKSSFQIFPDLASVETKVLSNSVQLCSLCCSCAKSFRLSRSSSPLSLRNSEASPVEKAMGSDGFWSVPAILTLWT